MQSSFICINALTALDPLPICFHLYERWHAAQSIRSWMVVLLLPDDHSFIHRNEILPRAHFSARHLLPFINAGRVGCSIRGRDLLTTTHYALLPHIFTIHPDGSPSHQSYRINRPVLLLCVGFYHAIHLTFD